MKYLKYFFIPFFILTSSMQAKPRANTSYEKSLKSVNEYFSLASEAFEKQNWAAVVENCKMIIRLYPNSVFTKEALFFLGVAYFNLNDYEVSNRYFTRYLKDDFNPKYFEEVMHYKFSIATHFKNGAKKRIFGSKGPKILFAQEDCIAIFDEIIASMPSHDLAVKALFAKGQLLFEDRMYKESLDVFEQIIDKFETHELAVESFIEIGKIYLEETTYKRQESDILDLAEVNLKRLKEMFPNATDKIQQLEEIVLQMKEKFALGYLNIAEFYQRTRKPQAAVIYYKKIIFSFSNTKYAAIAEKRLEELNEK